MEPPFTAIRFKNWVLQNGIVELSAGSKSTSHKEQASNEAGIGSSIGNKVYRAQYLKSQFRGLQSEHQTLKYFKNQGFIEVLSRAKTKIGEIDLILIKGHELRLVEVKSISSTWNAFDRISVEQLNKLRSNTLYMSRICQLHFKDIQEVRAGVAFVRKTQVDFCFVDEN